MPVARLLVSLAMLIVVPACQSEPGPPPEPSAEDGLKELVGTYKYIEYSKLPLPRKAEDFDNFIDSMPTALARIKQGEYVVAWGVGRAAGPAGGQVLAYEKKAPSEGGAVLLRDGTVKQMTAEEFRAAGVAK